MARTRAHARVLPEGSTLCGWCDEFETRADIAVEALRDLWYWCRRYHDDTGHDEEGAAVPCDPICEAMLRAEAALERLGEEVPRGPR